MSDFAEVKQRHEAEKAALERQIAEMLSGATTKNERKRLNQQAEKMRRDLFERQQEEADDPLFDLAASISRGYAQERAQAAPAPPPPPAAKSEAKINRAREKRLRKAQRQRAFEAQVAGAVEQSTRRGQEEQQRANEQLLKLGMKMRPVIGDGNCLYRSVAYCLSQLGMSEYADQNEALWALRQRTAEELRLHSDKYFEFSNCGSMEQFEEHCRRVETTSEWGGELEVTALSNALAISFVVHRVGFEPMKHGEQVTEIHLFFLEHFTSSGGHYNSVVRVN